MTPTQLDSIQADKLAAPKQIALTLTKRDNQEYIQVAQTLAKYNLSEAKHMSCCSPHVSKEKSQPLYTSLASWVKLTKNKLSLHLSTEWSCG
jgi:hypothetical protein